MNDLDLKEEQNGMTTSLSLCLNQKRSSCCGILRSRRTIESTTTNQILLFSISSLIMSYNRNGEGFPNSLDTSGLGRRPDAHVDFQLTENAVINDQ